MTQSEWIEKLNADAKALWNGEEGAAALDACKQAANHADLEMTTESGQCRVYRTPDGWRVNLWIEGVMAEGLEDGGFGFDDQVE